MASLSINANQATLPRQPIAIPGFAERRLPCSPTQQRFWLLEQLDPGNPALNVAVRWRLEGEVSLPGLEHAWRTIIARHQTLRTWFDGSTGEPVQCIEPEVEFWIPVIDLTGLAEEAATAEVDRIARLEARASFSLIAPPLIRVTCLRVRPSLSILLVTVHHLVSDGWSIGCLAREMGEICAAQHDGRTPDLPVLTTSYGDYALEQGQRLPTAEDDFWRRYLEGAKNFEVPAARPRGAVGSGSSEILSVLLDKGLSAGLSNLARRSGCTMFMAALAGLLVLLHRHTGETDISIGTQVAGRNDVEFEDLVGLFINTVILRNDLSGNPPFLEMLERVRDSVSEVLEHQQVPLKRLNEVLTRSPDGSATMRISVNFIFQRSFIENATYGGFRLVDLPSCSAGPLYDLNFFMVERAEGWRASCEFNADLFDAPTIAGFLDRLRNIFCAIVADPAQRVSQIPVLGVAERRRLIHDMNRTEAAYPDDRTLPQLFEAQVRRVPEATAVICGNREVRYRELDGMANRIAAALCGWGCRSGDRVGVFLERSPELIAALLAVHKVGAAYVPLDPSHPHGRLAHIIANSGLAAVLTQTALADRLNLHGTPTIAIDAVSATSAYDPVSPAPSPDDLAYVIYTSGSTGRPKGVQIQHRALVNLLTAMAKKPGLDSVDTLLAVTTVSFDIAGLEIFLPLIVGAKLVIAREQEVADGEALGRLLRRHEVTVLQATPATWKLLIDSGWFGDGRLKMLCGGESLPGKLAADLIARGGELWNMYGPTETTIWSATARLTAGENPVPIGTPIANTQFYVLDPHGELVPPGAPGELYIGGHGVAMGYLGLQELTAERFVPDKFSDRTGARLYRTGDIVRLLPSGKFAFVGRRDEQVKLRGYRIELGEIESVLMRDPQIAEAAATAGAGASGEVEIWAYVVQRHGAPANEASLAAAARSALNWYLPAYMQPAAVVVLPALPRMPNGKIDRGSLPPPTSAPVPGPVQAAVGDTERRMADIWSTLLGLHQVSADADFFDIGGNSLLASRLLSRIEASFGRRLSLASLFKARTVRGLARLVEIKTSRDFDFRQLVKLRPNSPGLPIVAVNNTGMYYELANRFCLDRPFTALQALEPSRCSSMPGQSVEELAAEYVRLLLGVHSNRGCLPMGWCVGGVLAYEVAQQLRRRNHDVPLLILIDSWVPGYLRRLPRHAALLADYSYRSQLFLSNWWAASPRKKQLSAFLACRNLLKRILPSFTTAGEDAGLRTADPFSVEGCGLQLQRYLDAASRRYEPRPYDGKILLIRCEQQPKPLFLDQSLGWQGFAAGGIEIASVPGDHFTMFREPGVGEMAKAISAALGRAGVLPSG